MNKIIALQGKGGSGKSRTIAAFHDTLLDNGYPEISGMYVVHGEDYSNVYTNGIIKIGVTSYGDSYKILMIRFKYLMESNCDIYVCACRTFDRKQPGTVAAVSSFPNYPPHFIQKTVLPKTATHGEQIMANMSDASKILAVIDKSYRTLH